jgi:hypothetical protein
MATSTADITVVAVFSNISTAQLAANELVSKGFSLGDIYLYSGEMAAFANEAKHAGQHSTSPEGPLKGWFKSAFGNEKESEAQREYEDAFKSGNTILALNTTQPDAARAADVLNRYSPTNVHAEAGDASAQTVAGTSVGTRGSLGTPTSRRSSTCIRETEPEPVPVREEQLSRGKRGVVRGDARIHSRVLEELVEESSHPRQERLPIERERKT